MTKSTVTESTFGQTVEFTKVSGSRANSMAKVFIPISKEKESMVDGATVSVSGGTISKIE